MAFSWSTTPAAPRTALGASGLADSLLDLRAGYFDDLLVVDAIFHHFSSDGAEHAGGESGAVHVRNGRSSRTFAMLSAAFTRRMSSPVLMVPSTGSIRIRALALTF